jgi:hypothetical protein
MILSGDQTCKHQWRALPDVKSDPNKGLTVSVYCYQCGQSDVARLLLLGVKK